MLPYTHTHMFAPWSHHHPCLTTWCYHLRVMCRGKRSGISPAHNERLAPHFHMSDNVGVHCAVVVCSERVWWCLCYSAGWCPPSFLRLIECPQLPRMAVNFGAFTFMAKPPDAVACDAFLSFPPQSDHPASNQRVGGTRRGRKHRTHAVLIASRRVWCSS